MIESFIHFFIQYNESVLWLAAGTVCALAVWLIYREMFTRAGSANLDTSDIEETLRRILSQTNAAIDRTQMQVDAGTGGVGGGTDLVAIKTELEEKAKLVESLKKEVEQVKTEDKSAALVEKVKELEGKLVEYEIIEDDIADLSHYKDENARLKKEIEGLKSGGPALVDAFAAEVSDNPSEQILAETLGKAQEQVFGDQDAALSAVSAPEAPVSVASSSADILASAVSDIQDVVTKGEVTQQGTAAVTEDTPGKIESKDNIFAEFTDPSAGTDPLADLGEIDTSRMLEELQGLSTEMDASALEDDPDVDKMAEEANQLDPKGKS